MFSIFKKSPIEKLKKQHSELLEQAMQAQRNGDIKSYSKLSEQAQSVVEQMDALEAEASN